MKKQTILKGIYSSVAFAGFVAAVVSCSKSNLSPEKMIGSSGNSTSNLLATPISVAYSPTIYGVQTGGTGGHNLYTIDRNNGAILTQDPISFYGGGGISHGALLGIAKAPGVQTGVLTVMSSCGGSSQFYSLNFSTKVAVGLGSVSGTYIKDIEYRPTTNIVYGIKDNLLVKITGFGSMCDGTATGNVPATYEVVGNLSPVGVGPYSISFNYLGDCAIMSAKDHKRAYVTLPATNYPSTLSSYPAVGLSGAVITALSPDLYSVSETASVISGTIQYIGLAGAATSTSTSTYDFYKWSSSSTGTLYYQLLDGNIYTGMADYTSETGTGTAIK